PSLAGWGLVAAGAALMAVTSGVWYSGSVLLIPLLETFGKDYEATSGIFALFGVLSGVFGMLTGHLVDRLGARRVILAGGLLLFCGHALSSLATARWHLYITHGVLTALGIAGMGWTPVSVYISRAFQERRGLMIGVASSGVGVGIAVFIPFTHAVIGVAGWRMGMLALGSVGSLIVLLVAWFALGGDDQRPAGPSGPLRTSPAVPAFERGLAAALRMPQFWLTAGTFACLNAPVQLMMTHQVAHLVEVGHSAALVGGLVGLVGLASAPGKVFWGWLSDRWQLEWAYGAAVLILAAALGVLLAVGPGTGTAVLYLYATLIGFGYAVAPALTPVMSARFFAGPRFGLMFGTLNMIHLAGGAIGIWVAGRVHDLMGSYRPALFGSYLSFGMALLFVWLAAPRRAGDPPSRSRERPDR
ncbi:MAG: MFS transporter, partial [Candidatus Methylomirabilota bacterium]